MEERKRVVGIMDWKLLATVTLIVLGLLVGVVALAWYGMSRVGDDAVRIWALVATLLLPVGIWAGYRLGHTEARGRLKGIDDGMDKVVSAASKAIDLRTQTIIRTREAAHQPSLVVLPPPEPSFRMLEEPRGQDIIELE